MYEPMTMTKSSCDIPASSYTRKGRKATDSTPAYVGKVPYQRCQNIVPEGVTVTHYTRSAKNTSKRNPAVVGGVNLTTAASKARAVDPYTARVTTKRCG